MSGRSLKEAAASIHNNDDNHRDVFELEGSRKLKVNLDGTVWVRTGTVVSYVGDIDLQRAGVREQGLGRLLKKTLSGQAVRLTRASGQGCLYLSDHDKNVQIVHLQDESTFVNGRDLLAFESTITWDIRLTKQLTAIPSAGLFRVKLQGTGLIALTTPFELLKLPLRPGLLRTDPNASVA